MSDQSQVAKEVLLPSNVCLNLDSILRHLEGELKTLAEIALPPGQQLEAFKQQITSRVWLAYSNFCQCEDYDHRQPAEEPE